MISPTIPNLYKFHYLLLVTTTKIFYFSLIRHYSKLNSSLYHALFILIIDIKFFLDQGYGIHFQHVLLVEEPHFSTCLR